MKFACVSVMKFLAVHYLGSDSVKGNLSVSTGHWKARRVQARHLLYPGLVNSLLTGLKIVSCTAH